MPDKQFLASMRARPWGGVFLSDKFLSSVEAAEAVTRELLLIYHQAGVVPLIESKIGSEQNLKHALALMEQAASLPAGSLCDAAASGSKRALDSPRRISSVSSAGSGRAKAAKHQAAQ